MAEMQCIVVTPEMTLLDETAKFVALPLYDGEIGIAPHHSPMIGRLGFGELRLVRDTGTERYYVDGGFVQVKDDVIAVLTNKAIPAGQIDRRPPKSNWPPPGLAKPTPTSCWPFATVWKIRPGPKFAWPGTTTRARWEPRCDRSGQTAQLKPTDCVGLRPWVPPLQAISER